METKALLTKLPSSWDDIKMKDFQKILELTISENESIYFDKEDSIGNIFDGVENSIKVLSVFLNMKVEELEQMNYTDILILAKKIEFVTKLPEVSESSSIKWKDFETISFNNFINFQTLAKEPLKNLTEILSDFSNLSKDEVMNLSIPDAVSGFFLLKKKLKESMKCLHQHLKWKLIRMKIVMMLQPWKLIKKAKEKNIKESMVGSS